MVLQKYFKHYNSQKKNESVEKSEVEPTEDMRQEYESESKDQSEEIPEAEKEDDLPF